MLKEKCIKGILETKDNGTAQNNELQQLKDEKQKKNSKFKLEKNH